MLLLLLVNLIAIMIVVAGRRSVHRDLESQLVITTTNRTLQAALHEEQQHLFSTASLVTRQTFFQPDRLVPYWVRFVIPVVKLFM